MTACFNINNPNFGCTTSGCSSCVQLAAGHMVPDNYSCNNGACVVAGLCPVPYQNCDPTKAYCEINTDSDPKNCGNCASMGGNDCTKLTPGPGATAIGCVQGNCRITTCGINAAGLQTADCNGDPSDGCEVALGPLNCWSCPPHAAPGVTPPACPCASCYQPGGASGICPTCMPGNTCDMTNKRCTTP
jgi:hypothetical protein